MWPATKIKVMLTWKQYHVGLSDSKQVKYFMKYKWGYLYFEYLDLKTLKSLISSINKLFEKGCSFSQIWNLNKVLHK